MIGKRMTLAQRDAYARLRAGEAIPVTVENGRVLHGLKRQGRARFMQTPQGRVARLRLNAAQVRANRREDARIIAAFEAYDALPATREGALPASKGRGRKLKHDEPGALYHALVTGGWIPEIEV